MIRRLKPFLYLRESGLGLILFLSALLVLIFSACVQAPARPTPTATLLPAATATHDPSPTVTREASPSPAGNTPTQISPTPTQTHTPVPQKVRFAVIGDYGSGSDAEGEVAALVKSWEPEFIITTGDNNYPDGSSDTIDPHIGQFFHEFIAPYYGYYGEGAQVNRFFPSLGNHDWHSPGALPYLDYFTLPGNERYYDFIWSPVHFFALDSDSNEPDGVGRSSQQAQWLQASLEASTSSWKIVYFHHGPYSSGLHGPVEWMQWPFAEWGADVVFSGHDHTYERITRDGIQYFVNGLGGASRYSFISLVEGSQVRYNQDYGAMLVEVTPDKVILQFINIQNQVVDEFHLTK